MPTAKPELLDWSHCRSLLALLRERSLAGAARRLQLSHPTLRRHLEALETAAGAPLFTRSPSGLAPTPLADSLREPAEAMEAAHAALLRQASGEQAALSGRVRIGASELVGVEVLPPLLRPLRERHPGLQLELQLSDQLDDVLRRDLDIAIRMSAPQQQGLLARRLGAVPLGVYAHTDWLRQHPGPHDPQALLDAGQWIGDEPGGLLHKALAERGLRLPRHGFGLSSRSSLAQWAALRAGLGLGVAQQPLAERTPGLQRLLPALTAELEVWLVGHPGQRGSRRVRACWDALAEGLERYLGRL